MNNPTPKYPDDTRYPLLVTLTALPERWIDYFTWHKRKHSRIFDGGTGGAILRKLESPEWSYEHVYSLNRDLGRWRNSSEETKQQKRNDTLKQIGEQVIEKIKNSELTPNWSEMWGFDSECFHALGSKTYENKFEFVIDLLHYHEATKFCNSMLFHKFGLSSDMIANEFQYDSYHKSESKEFFIKFIGLTNPNNTNDINKLVDSIADKFNNQTYDIRVKQSRKVLERLEPYKIKEKLNEENQSFLEKIENKSKRKNLLDREEDTAFPISDEEFDSNIVDKSNIREPRFNELKFNDEKGNERHK